MPRLDAFVVFLLEGLSDKFEDRYGRVVGWWLTLATCLAVLAATAGLWALMV